MEILSEMIPFLTVYPNPNDVGLPPTSFGCEFKNMSLLDEIAAMQGEALDPIVPTDISAFDDFLQGSDGFSGGFDLLKPDIVRDKVLRYDCKWSGCDPECKKTHGTNIYLDHEELMCPNDMYSQCIYPVKEVPPYTPDYDHCYYALPPKETLVTVKTEPDDKLEVLKNIPTPPSTSDSPSETSSEDEVDVVTVPEEYYPPIVTRHDYLPRRSNRNPRFMKKNSKRSHQAKLSARSLKAAMKRTRMQSIRRPYRRRKIHNSVETTPSSSMPSSAHSSRCNSDNEDVDKRRTHNSSERKRREAQRTALQNLRVCIPDLQNNPKAPKVLILNSATSLVKRLKQNKETLKELRHRETQRKQDLLAKLNMLRMKLKLDKLV